MARDGTVASAAAVDTWTSFVKAGLGALGFALLAVAPLVGKPAGFAYLSAYVFVAGGLLTLQAATMRLRSMLIVLGTLGLSAALAFTVVGNGAAQGNQSALALYCGAAVILGAAGRHIWMALPFLIIPVLILAPTGVGWQESRAGFSAAWATAMGCDDCLWGGLPAGLAVVGAAIGQLRVKRPVPVQPSALPLILTSAGLLMAGLVLGSLLPDALAFARTTCLRAALLAGVLLWVAMAYQVGRMAFVYEAAAACLLVLAGALFLDPATQFPGALGSTFAITVATSLVPAVLAGVGLLVRKWIGKERPDTSGMAGPTPTQGQVAKPAYETPSGPVFAPRAAPPTEGTPAEPQLPPARPPPPGA